MENKEWTKEWNPFNSQKLYSQVYRWREIAKSNPAPVTVTIDPTNICNLNCVWCNADYIRNKNPSYITNENLKYIADNLSKFSNHPRFPNVETVCIAGGGEPTNHEYTGRLVNDLNRNGVKAGLVSNGTHLDEHPELVNCEWVGISMDCGTPHKYKELKKGNYFKKVINNIADLAQRSKGHTLDLPGQGHGISYKYLLHPRNCGDVYEAAKIAKEIGCRNLHIRPFGLPWNKVNTAGNRLFSIDDIDLFRDQLIEARKLEDENFGVFGVTHKFDGNFSKKNQFKKCHAIQMEGVFEAPTDKKSRFNFGLCCDRRGDNRLTLENIKDFNEIRKFWGSDEHRKKIDLIKPELCPRCTYQPHNKLYENVVEVENTTYDFI